VDKGKAALDANADGKVEAKEVADALIGRVMETGEAIATAAGEVKEGFDADGDGKVSFDEVKVVADGVASKVTGAVSDLVGKMKGEAAEATEAEVVAIEEVDE